MLIEHQTVRHEEVGVVCADIARGDVDLLAEKIRSGRAFLQVIAYPWGVEFDVCEFSAKSASNVG